MQLHPRKVPVPILLYMGGSTSVGAKRGKSKDGSLEADRREKSWHGKGDKKTETKKTILESDSHLKIFRPGTP